MPPIYEATELKYGCPEAVESSSDIAFHSPHLCSVSVGPVIWKQKQYMV